MTPPIRHSRQRRRPRAGRRGDGRLRLECLETRRLLATLVVNSFTDAVDADPGDGICQTMVANSCSLRAAIQEANALPNAGSPDQIILPAGTHTLSIAGMDEQQAARGDLDISDDVILQGAGAQQTIIDAAGVDRVMDIVVGAAEINGVTIRGGLIEDDDDPVEGSGGGIRNEGDLTINDSIITGNVSPLGAGIANYNGTVRIFRSRISGNGDLTTTRGGGISNYGNYDPATLEITDSTIADNRADTGGGVANRSYDSVTALSISRSTLSGNEALNGGAISNRAIQYYAETAASNLTIVGSTISGNTANVSGGGIANESDFGATASLEIASSTIANNTAVSGDGGGIASESSPDVNLTIRSVILAGNSAGGEGPDLSSDVTTALFSLIESPLGHSLIDGLTGNLVGEEAGLGPLQANGGPTLTHLPLLDSPVIDQGSNSELEFGDQRGSAFARTVDDPSILNARDGTDIGAVEFGAVAATLDFGDAPEAVVVGGRLRRYPTRLASDAARHRVTPGGPRLGTFAADAEADGQASATATGDDATGIDDEDSLGQNVIVLVPGQTASGVVISHHGGDSGARLNAWIDFNLDGDWDDPGEQVLTDALVPSGPASTSLAETVVPSNSAAGTSFIRVRISTETGLATRGEAVDGEVEDFVVTIGAPPPRVADLSLTQRVDQDNPTLGQDVTFTITVTNDGPDPATNVEVEAFLPLDLIFTRSSQTQGQYDDLDGFWLLGDLNAGVTAVLTITATVDNTDPITHRAEISAVDQGDPDSTPANGVVGEDDQASVTLGTRLQTGPVQIGINRVTYSGATPGSFVAFVRGTTRGSSTFDQFAATVNIADAQDFALSVVDRDGNASALFSLRDDELDATVLLQAFQIGSQPKLSNTLSLDVTSVSAASDGGLSPLTNSRNALDVNDDQNVSALDALLVVNRLSRLSDSRAVGSSATVAVPDPSPLYLDTNGDSRVTALDALRIINHLGAANTGVADAELPPPGFLAITREGDSDRGDVIIEMPRMNQTSRLMDSDNPAIIVSPGVTLRAGRGESTDTGDFAGEPGDDSGKNLGSDDLAAEIQTP
jgi:uncharacterized repeat protein (TIGR01451 family)/CSLREA domain-containing protein